MKELKKLSLKKETLLNLQEKQLKAIVGGEVMMSNGTSSTYSCSGNSCFCPNVTIKRSVAPMDDVAASCCKKTCNG